VLALVFVAAHVPFLAPALEDVDSSNFALGLREFNPALHQPHPPGYPFFIALGKLAQAAGLGPVHALAIWGPLFGACAVFALVRLFAAIDAVAAAPETRADGHRALLATVVTVTCPLFWFTAVRPMSDVPGLAVALVAQALLATAWRRQRDMPVGDRASLVASGRLIVLGALAAALAMGFRAQTIWLTAPLLCLVLARRIGRDAAGALLGASTAFAIGTALWAVPVVMASRGARAYLDAVASQVGEDLSGVEMLARTPTIRRLAEALGHTLVSPWDSTVLAVVVMALGVVGAVVLRARGGGALLLVAVLALPYAAFHLAFQETVTVRYALPLIPAVCYLAVRGLSFAGPVVPRVGAIALAAWSLALAAPATGLYARSPSPIAQALSDVRAAAAAVPDAPALGLHFAFARAVQAIGADGLRTLPARPGREWLEVVRLWQREGPRQVWFFADPGRTDLALIDPRGRKIRRSYRWPSALGTLVSGVRPTALDWLVLDRPGWFLAEGWALTPETAGVARADGHSPARAPIVGYVRRRAGPLVALIGGRNLASAGDARVDLTLDGRAAATFTASSGFFLEILTLPPMAGDSLDEEEYVRLEAAVTDGGDRANVAIEQFDIQPVDELVWGYGTGWHEPELNTATRRQWRWMSERAELRVHATARGVRMALTGESPLRYFSRPPVVVIRAGERVLTRETLTADFAVSVRVPRDALAAADGRITIETDETWVPAERSRSADRRRLGLRVWTMEIVEER
jgi:hypothetical protein